tara:strand:- start:6968 stop:8506 length:1539 start_codon:yes stop_codon:yes gene_type:complete
MGYNADKFRVTNKGLRDKLRGHADLDFGVYLGEIIVRPKDATHAGRLTVYIPMLSKDRDDPNGYYNAYWSSPFAGSTHSAKIGQDDQVYGFHDTQKTYGMWMVPPDPGNFVLVCFADGKRKFPVVISCMFPDQLQNMVPGNAAGAAFGTDIKVPVAEKNRNEESVSHSVNAKRPIHPYVTKAILQQGLINDPVRGISISSARRESPSQVFGILTPGPEIPNLRTSKKDNTHREAGHSIVLDDGDIEGGSKNIRIRTGGGHQILLDDTSGDIYIINKKGTAWIEMSDSGDINVYADNDFNMRAKGNVNIRADKNLNLEANSSIYVQAGEYETADTLTDVDGNPKGNFSLNIGNSTNWLNKRDFVLQTDSTGAIHLTSGTNIQQSAVGDVEIAADNRIKAFGNGAVDIKSGGDISSQASNRNNVLGSTVHLNDGGSAEQAGKGRTAVPHTISEFEDQPIETPVWEYPASPDEVDENTNPMPTDGKRDGVVDKIKSLLGIITTREPWAYRPKNDD